MFRERLAVAAPFCPDLACKKHAAQASGRGATAKAWRGGTHRFRV